MKPISARANFNQNVVDRLFSTADRARDTAAKVLAARNSASGKFVSHGLTLSTDKKARDLRGKSQNAAAPKQAKR
jgi:hypothetical protein